MKSSQQARCNGKPNADASLQIPSRFNTASALKVENGGALTKTILITRTQPLDSDEFMMQKRRSKYGDG
jgi:hypothetical protein